MQRSKCGNLINMGSETLFSFKFHRGFFNGASLDSNPMPAVEVFCGAFPAAER